MVLFNFFNLNIKLIFYGENGEVEYAGDPGSKDRPSTDLIKNEQWLNGYLKGTNLEIRSYATNETYILATQNAGVDLYFNANKKLDTEDYGIEVTGTVGTDTLIVTGVSTVASLIFSAGTNTNGVSYFDANGQVQSTVSPASGISTSNSILTTNASGVPIWTDTIDCGTF